jgi:hypothetical protein
MGSGSPAVPHIAVPGKKGSLAWYWHFLQSKALAAPLVARLLFDIDVLEHDQYV